MVRKTLHLNVGSSQLYKNMNCPLNKQVGFLSQVWPFTTSRDNSFESFTSQMYTILRRKVSGVTGQFKWRDWNLSPDVTDSFTWRYWTVSPDVTGQFHLALLDRITWRYWKVSTGVTASPDVTGQFHLALLDRITWRYCTVSLVITEPIGQFHLALLKPITWRYRTAIELFNMQRPSL